MFCRHCGTEARGSDRHCTKCGQPLDAAGDDEHGPSYAPYSPPRTPRFRIGRFVAAHARGLLALLVVAAIGLVAALAGESDDTAPRAADAAPAAAVTSEENAVDQHSAAPRTTSTTKAPRRVGITGADGHTYYCSGSALSDADSKRARADRRGKVLAQRKSAFRSFLAAHPEKDLSQADFDRYKFLRARYSAQLKYTNSAIDSYNRVLLSKCDQR